MKDTRNPYEPRAARKARKARLRRREDWMDGRQRFQLWRQQNPLLGALRR